MTPAPSILLTLAWQFAFLSLFAIGGANVAIPEMHRLAVDVMGWMTERQFNDLFAIAQLSPGPNVLVVTLIGYQAAGIPGAVVATAGMCGPTCIFAYWFGKFWDRFREAPWRMAVQAGLVPVAVGLIAASAYLIAMVADTTIIAIAITMATATIVYTTRVNPLWLFAVAGILGSVGLL